jgi:ribulose-bisphosphate carboxylase large chain
VLGIAPATTGNEASQLMNMLFGNCSLQPEVELIDVKFPPGYEQAFPGPRFGIEGIRTLTGVARGPLTCTALKPQGAPMEHLVQLARTFTLAGIDIIKDDHGIANQAYCPFEQRVPAVQKAIAETNRETGGNTIYAPTVSGGTQAIVAQARIAKESGVRMALIAPMLVGIPAFIESQVELDLPVMAHPAFAGATRIAAPLLLGRLFRLFGADATIFPNHGGRFSFSRETCLAIAKAARAPWEGVKPVLPVPAGGMTIERVDEMIEGYGPDTMLLIGGGLLAAKDQLLMKSREFVAAVKRHRTHRGQPTVFCRAENRGLSPVSPKASVEGERERFAADPVRARAVHKQCPGLAAGRAEALERARGDHRHVGRVLRIAHRFVEDHSDVPGPRDAPEGLRARIIRGMRPGRAVGIERGLAKIHRAIGDGHRKQRERYGRQFLERGGIHQEALPSPPRHFRAGGANLERGIEGARILGRAEARAGWPRPIAERRGQQIVQSLQRLRDSRLGIVEKPLEPALFLGRVDQAHGRDDVLRLDRPPDVVRRVERARCDRVASPGSHRLAPILRAASAGRPGGHRPGRR